LIDTGRAEAARAGVQNTSVRLGSDGAAATWGIVVEAPVHLVVNGETRAVLMATPQDLADLARGVLHTELGLPVTCQAVIGVQELLGEYRVDVQLAPHDAEHLRPRGQSLMANSACGLCGIEALADLSTRTTSHSRVSPASIPDEAILAAFDAMATQQPVHAATRSAHAAAWCTPVGEVRVVREDVGRHNALDKLIGALIAMGMPGDGIIVMSSRCSYELVHKAAHTPARLLATWSAPTSMALEWARHLSMPVVSVARPL
jgi:FdhD protein